MEEILFETKTVYSIVKITKDKIEGASGNGFSKKKQFSINISDIKEVKFYNFSPGIIYNTVIVYDKSNNIFEFCYRRKYRNKFKTVKQFLDKINDNNKIAFEIEQQEYAKEEENRESALIEREKYGIPSNITDSVKLYADGSFHRQFQNEYIIYNNGNKLIFYAIRDYDKNNCLKRFDFNLSDILYFKKEGSRNVTTKISGGETITKNDRIINHEEIYYLNKALGGKTDNEVIGAMLASKDEKDTAPIKTTKNIDDDRKVVLKLKDSEIYFTIDSYNVFLKVISNKDYEQVLLNNNNSNYDGDYRRKLEDLKKLLDDGLIDEHDYTRKKDEILFGQKK